MEAKDLPTRLQEIAEELRAMASNGLHFGHDEYDIARYHQVMKLAAELMAMTDTRTAEEIERIHSGHIDVYTPKVGATAVIFDAEGRILLIRRSDNGMWALPGGWADVGESPSEAAAREAFEETDLQVKSTRLLGVYDSRKSGSRNPHHIYLIVFICEATGGNLTTSNETTAFGYFAEDDLPTDLHPSSQPRLSDAFRWQRGEDEGPFFQ